MSSFGALWASVQPVHDAHWGEPVLLIPQANDASSEYVESGADSQRPTREIVGIAEFTPVVDRYVGQGANENDNTDVLANQSTIDFDDALFDEDTAPQSGDILALTERPRQPSFRIVTVDHNNASRWVCRVIFDRNLQ